MAKKIKTVLQLCHSYGTPFADVARQWRVLFDDPDNYQVVTVFLLGAEQQEVTELVAGEVIYWNYQSRDLRGLKREQIKKLRQLDAQYHFDLVIAQRYKPIYIALKALNKTPVYGVAHAYGVFDQFFRRRLASKNSQRLSIVGVSNAISDDVRKDLPNYPPAKIFTVYNRIDSDKYRQELLSKTAAREYLKLDQEAMIVANVGRLHPDKDQRTLIKGFAQWLGLDKQHAGQAPARARLLVLIGSGRLEQSLKQLVTELGLDSNVLFLGQVKDAWQYFKAFDVFALSSDYEPFGMVLLEAMIAGVPVIATNVGGAPEVVGEHGELFAVGDHQALGEGLARITSQKTDSKKQSQVLIEWVERNFSDAAIKKDFLRRLN